MENNNKYFYCHINLCCKYNMPSQKNKDNDDLKFVKSLRNKNAIENLYNEQMSIYEENVRRKKAQNAYEQLSNSNKDLVDEYAKISPQKEGLLSKKALNLLKTKYTQSRKKETNKTTQKIKQRKILSIISEETNSNSPKRSTKKNNSISSELPSPINSSRKTSSTRNKRETQRLSKKVVTFEKKIHETLLPRKYTKLIKSYRSDLENSGELFGEVCSTLKSNFDKFFLGRNADIKRVNKNYYTVQEHTGEFTTMTRDQMEEYKNNSENKRRLLCYFLDVLGFINNKFSSEERLKIFVKGGRALQIMSSKKSINIRDRLSQLYDQENSTMLELLKVMTRNIHALKMEDIDMPKNKALLMLLNVVGFTSEDLDIYVRIPENPELSRMLAKKLESVFVSIMGNRLSVQDRPDDYLVKVSYDNLPQIKQPTYGKYTALLDIGYGIPEGTDTDKYFEHYDEFSFGEGSNKRVYYTQKLDDFKQEKQYMIENNQDNAYIHMKALKSLLLAEIIG